jgi:hypothetical protein
MNTKDVGMTTHNSKTRSAAARTNSTHTPSSPPAWKFVDRWVRDPKIRRDTLIALGMILGAAVVLVLACTALLAPLAVKILTGSVAGGGLGWGGYRLARRRRRGRGQSEKNSVPQQRRAGDQ